MNLTRLRNFRISPNTYQYIVLAALVALTIIIVTGGAVRVTGSGLGCPDWPTCHNDRLIAPWEKHAMIEFVNRVFTGVVVVAVAVGVLGSLLRKPRRLDLTLWSLSLVLGVIAQAVLGGLTVWYDLAPAFVASHFLLSQLVVWAALILYRRARQPDGQPMPVVHRDYVWLGRAALLLAIAVLVLGTVVTGSGPHGGDPDVQRYGFEVREVTKIHGILVWMLVAVTSLTVWRLHVANADKTLVKKGEIVLAALLLQGAIGYLQYALAVPAGLVLLHIAGATAVWISMVWFNLSFHERWGELGVTAYDGPEKTSEQPEQA